MEEIREMNVAYQNPINIDTYLLGVVQMTTRLKEEYVENKLKHILKVFIVGNNKNRQEKIYDKPQDISKLLKWCRDGNTALYDQLFYIPNKEDRKELLEFLLDFLNINRSCFDGMEYTKNQNDFIEILGELEDVRNR